MKTKNRSCGLSCFTHICKGVCKLFPAVPQKSAEWLWVCRNCKAEYPEDGKGLLASAGWNNQLLRTCSCGGVVDLTAVREKISA